MKINMNSNFNLVVYFDGNCWPNPKGAMGLGVTIIDRETNKTLESYWEAIPINIENTINVAEALSFCRALKLIKGKYTGYKSITFKGDSSIIVTRFLKDLKGKCYTYNKTYQKVIKECVYLARIIKTENKEIGIQWIPSHKNIADPYSRMFKQLDVLFSQATWGTSLEELPQEGPLD